MKLIITLFLQIFYGSNWNLNFPYWNSFLSLYFLTHRKKPTTHRVFTWHRYKNKQFYAISINSQFEWRVAQLPIAKDRFKSFTCTNFPLFYRNCESNNLLHFQLDVTPVSMRENVTQIITCSVGSATWNQTDPNALPPRTIPLMFTTLLDNSSISMESAINNNWLAAATAAVPPYW